MKPCCVCTCVGMIAGMLIAAYFISSNKKVQQFVTKSKDAIEDKISNISDKIANK